MGAPSFKDCLAADISNTFLNTQEFADTHLINGKEMAVQVDENELLERDKARVGTNLNGLYRSRRLIYVAKSEYGKRPAIDTQVNFDGRFYKITDCAEEGGVLAITLEANKT